MQYMKSDEIVFYVESLKFKLVYCDSPLDSFFFVSNGDLFLTNIKRKNAFSAMKKLYKKYGKNVMSIKGHDTIF